jgi:basic amino acid/polyamine antiporter, APA family
MTPTNGGEVPSPGLIRGISLRGATALNMIDMIGVGPFITIPLIVAAMGGPQAIIGWVVGAVLVMCDGLVWAELGAAIPGTGGSYRYLKEMYNPAGAGKMMAFLYVWQLSFSAPLSIASGCIGLASYAGYIFPSLAAPFYQHTMQAELPFFGPLTASVSLSPGTFVAMGICLLAVVLLSRDIRVIGKISQYLWIGVLLTIAWIIITGLTHFNAARAFSFPPDAFAFSPAFFTGLGAGMLVAIYDYWGYYNICFLGGEVNNPEKNIPRAILLSILLVGIIYIVMNISILGVIPWQEISATAGSDARRYIISVFMERIHGQWAGTLVTGLIIWTAFASVFSLLLGYSRIPYAAALEGDYFPAFAKLHPVHRFPRVSLITLGIVAIAFCTLRLSDVIAALVVIRIIIQFLGQTIGSIIYRVRRPDVPRPFRMWLYPLPAIIAFCGFLAVVIMRPDFLKEIRYAALLIVAGLILYTIRSWKRREWPFALPASGTHETDPS